MTITPEIEKAIDHAIEQCWKHAETLDDHNAVRFKNVADQLLTVIGSMDAVRDTECELEIRIRLLEEAVREL